MFITEYKQNIDLFIPVQVLSLDMFVCTSLKPIVSIVLMCVFDIET